MPRNKAGVLAKIFGKRVIDVQASRSGAEKVLEEIPEVGGE